MVSISACTLRATDHSVCGQPPAKVAVVALGVLTCVGAGVALGLRKLSFPVSSAMMSVGGVGAVAAGILWPVSEVEEERGSDLAEVTELTVADFEGESAADFARLIEACPNLRRVDVNGFSVRFSEGSAAGVIRALARSSVERIDADGCWDLFAGPESVQGALSDTAEQESYRKRLNVFDEGWAQPETAEQALQLMQEMPHVEHFWSLYLEDPGVDDLLDHLEAHVPAQNWRLGQTLGKRLRERIQQELDGELSDAHRAYLASREELRIHEWSLCEDRVLQLLRLMPNAMTINLYRLSRSYWTDDLAEELVGRRDITPPFLCWLDYRAEEWGPADLFLLKLNLPTDLEIRVPLKPKIFKALADAGAGFKSLALIDPTDEIVANLVGVSNLERLDLTGVIGLTEAGMGQLVDAVKPGEIWFNPSDDEVGSWKEADAIWASLERNYDLMEWKEGAGTPWVDAQAWEGLKDDPTQLLSGDKEGVPRQIYLRRKGLGQ